MFVTVEEIALWFAVAVPSNVTSLEVLFTKAVKFNALTLVKPDAVNEPTFTA